MDAKTEKALRQSIEKWEKNSRVRKLERAEIYTDTCPLCKIYNRSENPAAGKFCAGCPVEKVGAPGCIGSPWHDCFCAFELSYDISQFRAAAREEVAFLKSLLPENEQ